MRRSLRSSRRTSTGARIAPSSVGGLGLRRAGLIGCMKPLTPIGGNQRRAPGRIAATGPRGSRLAIASDIASTPLVAEDTLVIDHFRSRPARRAVCVTFTERTNARLDGYGFGGGFLLKAGLDVVAVKTNLDAWYRNLQPGHVMAIRRAITGYDTRSGYGSSMGAYAALRLSGALGLHHVLALSPLQSIHHDWDGRYAADRPLAGEGQVDAGCMAPGCRYVLAADPTMVDGRHVALLRALIPETGFVFVGTPYAGHPAGPYLRDIGLLQPLARAALLGEPLPEAGPYRAGKRGSVDYLFNLAEACLARRMHRAALGINSLALALRPDWGEVYIQRCKCLRGTGNLAEAVVNGEKAVHMLPCNPHVLAYVLLLMVDAGRTAEAGSLLEAFPQHLGHPALKAPRERLNAAE